MSGSQAEQHRVAGGWDAPGRNLAAVTTDDAADVLNADFYGQIQFPGPPAAFERLVEPGFWARMLAQDLGYWGETIVGSGSEIWVAGCGTNQALITALRFPEARVLGSDLSEQSLSMCMRHAGGIGVPNLQVRRESINDVDYRERFDYILCTGVIHHNAHPQIPLQRLARALTPGGILELMVYNQYHRVCSAAFQLVVRTLVGSLAQPDLRREMPIAKKIVETFTGPGVMRPFLMQYQDRPFPYFADTLLQPIEHSFTVGSLRAVAEDCGLELAAFALDHLSRGANTIDWNMWFQDDEVQRLYEALPDADRWQITNHLLLDQSPMLWFYLQRTDSPRTRRSERQKSEDLARLRFRRTRTEKEMFVQREGTYVRAPQREPFPPPPHRHAGAARVYHALAEDAPLGDTLRRLGMDASFRTLHSLRVHLATSAFPYLVAV